MILAELHCHTYRSKDCLMMPERLLETARSKGIERLAITDHSEVEGAREAQALDPDLVIVGEEVYTTQGEMLAYFIDEWIPPGLEPMDAIRRMRDQGAVISVAHPLDPFRGGAWQEPALREILPYVDALEIFNARTVGKGANERAQELAAEVGLPGTAGSDAHAYVEVGTAGLRLPDFDDAEGMRAALKEAEMVGKLSSPLVHFFSRYATFRKRLGWRPKR
ncbi:MAG: PHP-associated domain-containing protein [Anaerolineales bacterium]